MKWAKKLKTKKLWTKYVVRAHIITKLRPSFMSTLAAYLRLSRINVSKNCLIGH